MKVTINTSPVKDAGLALSREIASLLLEWGASVWVDEQAADFYRGLSVICAEQRLCFREADFAISVGGDGTFLKTAHLATPHGVPVLGVNKGTVGFLTEVEPGELHELRRLMTGDFKLERRMMLQA